MPKKGYKQTLEHKTKNNKKGINNPMFGVHRIGKDNPFYGKKHSEETKNKIGEKNKGKIHLHTEETKKRISISHKDKRAYNWKGNKVGYNSLHQWVRRNLGIAKTCDECAGTKGSTKFEWSNIDHKYKRELKEYKQLCSVCHREHDKIIRKRHKEQDET